MDKVKEISKNNKNGEKINLTRDEMIKQVETEIANIVKIYHQKTGYLAALKELD